MNQKTEVTMVTQRGQTSIPSHLRKATRLSRGDRLSWEKVSDSEFRVRVVRKGKRKPDPAAMIGFAQRHGLPGGRSDGYMRAMRAGEKIR
jgi:bifunctional DNA-binding transcriptional regulator/antitoxin component of YhaV-PrlF toxin-antitoxin module